MCFLGLDGLRNSDEPGDDEYDAGTGLIFVVEGTVADDDDVE